MVLKIKLRKGRPPATVKVRGVEAIRPRGFKLHRMQKDKLIFKKMKDHILSILAIFLTVFLFALASATTTISDSGIFTPWFNTTGNSVIGGDLHMIGVLTHDSPVLIREGIEIVTADGADGYQDAFHIFISTSEERAEADHPGLTNETDNSLIFFTHNLANTYKMGYMFFDDTTNRSSFVINQGGINRASLFDRSLMVGKTLGIAPIDENYSLCQGFNLIDCDTSSTGADLGVEDDIEAKGSILAQGDITANYFIGDGSQLTGVSGGAGANDTIWNITGSNYMVNSSGILEVNETKLNETIDSRGNWNTYLNLSGTNANQDINISPYNLQTGNITANYGVFGWLGSIANRITSLFVVDINASGNITANYFIGDGSQLAGVNIITESTGLIQGGVVSVNGGDITLIDISAGSGQIVNSTTDPDNPTLTPVSWANKTGYNLTTMPSPGDVVVIYLALDSGGNVVERSALPTPEERRDTIDLGLAARIDNGIVVFAGSGPTNVIHNPGSQVQDLMEAWGAFNIDGNRIQSYGAGLQIQKAAGSVFRNGANFQTNGKNPHVVSLSEQIPVDPFNYKLGDGTDITLEASQIDPDNYDDGTSTLATVPNNKWTVQYISVFSSNVVEVLYGQEIFDSESEATAAMSNIYFTIPVDSKNAVPLAYVILQQGDTSLTNDRFYRISRGGAAGGGGVTYSAGTGIEIINSLINLNTTYTDTLYLGTEYTSLSNFTDDILWTSEFNSTGDARWSGGGGSDTWWNITSSNYLINNSNILDINGTKINATIASVTGWDNGTGPYSIKWGESTVTGGSHATAWGYYTTASGIASTAWGVGSIANGNYATAWGDYTTASGQSSTAWGAVTTASGDYATAWGNYTTANGDWSTAFGGKMTVDGVYSVGIGLSDTPYTLSQSNTMAIMGGNVGIGTVSPTTTLEVAGDVKIRDDLNMTSNNITAVDCLTFISGGRICDSP